MEDNRQQKTIASGEYAGEEKYWLDKLSGPLERSAFPRDFKEDVNAPRVFDTVEFAPGGELFSRLMKLVNKSDFRLHMVLVTALATLLHKYTGNTDIILGTPAFKQEFEARFINTVLVLRNRVEGAMTYKELLLTVRQTISEAVENQNYPLETLLYQLNLSTAGTDFPLFDVAVLLENVHDREYIRHINPNVVFSFRRTGGGLEGTLEYNPAYYKPSTVKRIAAHFINLLRDCFADMNAPVSELGILSEEEKRWIMVEFNGSGASPAETKLLHELFEEQVDRTPGHIAVLEDGPVPSTGRNHALTFRELDSASNRLARVLRANGIGPGRIAAISTEHPLTTAAGILAVLKAGGAYLPVDVEYPRERICFMLEDSGVDVVMSDRENHLIHGISTVSPVLNIHIGDRLFRRGDNSALSKVNRLSDTAYVIYTSGSTGRPRGVVIEHRNVVNTLAWRKEEYKIAPGDVSLQLFSYSFDGFVTGFFTPLISGAKVVLMSMDAVRDASAVKRAVVKNRVSHFISVPSLYSAIIDRLTPGDCERLRVVTLAGERFSPSLLEITRGKNRNIEVAHEYGVTEAAVMSTLLRHQELEPRILIGKPVGGTGIYILSRDGEPVPMGVPGELCITGRGVGRGYLNNPELTAERFNRSYKSYRTYKTYCLYRTGDLARWLDDGNIEFLGRIDHQVKLRGYRIEPGEIEQRLSAHEKIREAVVIAGLEENREPYLCAYFVPLEGTAPDDGGFDPVELRKFLSETLPGYMLPRFFEPLEKFPVTPNGKIDKKALLTPSALHGAKEYIAPRGPVERKLARVWSEVLGVEEETLGIDHNFFEIGGHSLNATILVSVLHKEFNVGVSLRTLFGKPSIRELAKYIAQSTHDLYEEIRPVEKREYYPQSSAQKRLFFLDHFESIGTSYNTPSVLKIAGPVDKERFDGTFNALIARHEALRTSFHLLGNEAVQEIHESVDFETEIIEIGVEEEDIERVVKAHIQPFDLTVPPLLHAAVITTAEAGNYLLFDMHHIIGDGTSMGVLIDDFMRLYEGEELPPLVIQYKDFTLWRKGLFESGKIEEQEKYWLDLYSTGIPRLNLSTDYPRPAVYSYEGDVFTFKLDGDENRRFRALCSEAGATLFMNLFAVFNILLHKYTGREDIVVGTAVAGRPHADLQGILGMFVNMLAIRNYPGREKSYLDFLREVGENAVKAFENQDMQFEELVEKLDPRRDASRNPLFSVSLVVQNFQLSERKLSEIFESPFEYDNKTTKFDISIHAVETEHEIYLNIVYYTGIFKRETMARLAGHFKNIVGRVNRAPRVQIGDIDIVTEAEKELLLRKFNDTAAGYEKEASVHRLFEEQVEKTPGKTAVVYGEKSITYRELDRQADRLAAYLRREKNLRPGERVGILMERNPMTTAALLGVMKAGGAYVPFDESFPPQRIKHMIDDADIHTVISQKKYIGFLNRLQWECKGFHTFLCTDTGDIQRDEAVEAEELIDIQKKLWEYVGETAGDEIAGGGWNSSYTGQPFSKREMDEYGDNILEKLTPLLHKEMRVLEIGCASGISMYRIAPRVGLYYGTDLSEVIIEKNKRRAAQEGHTNIRLAALPAHQIRKIQKKDFDLIVINSVIQSFPGHAYFREVIRNAVELLNEKGYLFIGDVMDQELKKDLEQDLARFKKANRDKNYKTKTDFSTTLFLSRAFFHDLGMEIPDIRRVEFSPKIYNVENELTRFRYDTLITVDKTRGKIRGAGQKHKYRDDLRALEKYRGEPVPSAAGGNGLAYVIYTSGSTGKPKGVLIEHRSVINVVCWFARQYGVDGDSRVLQLTDYTFDASVNQVFGTLLHGGTLYIAGRELRADILELRRYIERNRVHIVNFVPPVIKELLGHDRRLESLRAVICGGEELQRTAGDMLLEKGYDLYNQYGPTETTIDALAAKCREDGMTLGKPIANTNVYILDDRDRPRPVGIPGELCISGAGVGRGYLNSPGLTAEKFVKNPFTPGETMYRSGDLARWLPDGTVEFLGRIDFQVKVRGFRIELGEIESKLMKHSEVREAVVVTHRGKNGGGTGDTSIWAYIVPGPGVCESFDVFTAELKEELSRELPGYMIPSRFSRLERVPLTATGKVDRNALPGPAAATAPGYTPPGDEIETGMVRLWAGALGLKEEAVGIDSDFFALGGHSLRATIVVSQMHREFDIKVPLAEIFKTPTIRALAAYVRGAARDRHTAVEPVEKKEYYPVPPAQERIFLLHRMDPQNISYNIHNVVVLEGALNREKTERVFRKLIERHETFRTSFALVGNEPVQRIHDDVEFKIDHYGGDVDPGSCITGFIRPFDLGRAPLLRVGLIKRGETEHILMVDMHHTISDGTSTSILFKEFMALHSGEEPAAPPVQYKDFSQWQRGEAQTKRVSSQETYWLERFNGEIPVLNLPADFDRPGIRKFEGRDIHFELDETVTARLREFAAGYDATLFMALLAMFNIFLAKICKTEDVVIGTLVAGRMHSDLEKVVGMFVNPLALRNFPGPGKTAGDFMTEVRETTLDAFKNQECPFENWVEKMNVIKDTGRGMLFDVLFAFHNMEQVKFEIPGLTLKPYERENRVARFDLTLQGSLVHGKIRLWFEYNTALFREETVNNFIRLYKKTVRLVLEDPGRKIAGLEVAPPAGKKRENRHLEMTFKGERPYRLCCEVPDVKALMSRLDNAHVKYEAAGEGNTGIVVRGGGHVELVGDKGNTGNRPQDPGTPQAFSFVSHDYRNASAFFRVLGYREDVRVNHRERSVHIIVLSHESASRVELRVPYGGGDEARHLKRYGSSLYRLYYPVGDFTGFVPTLRKNGLKYRFLESGDKTGLLKKTGRGIRFTPFDGRIYYEPDPSPRREYPVLSRGSGSAPVEPAPSQAFILIKNYAAGDTDKFLMDIRIKGRLNVEVFEKALAVLAARHTALRTTFADVDGALTRSIGEKTRIDYEFHEPGHGDRGIDLQEIETLFQAEIKHRFDLPGGSLFRCKLVRLSGDEHLFMCNFHGSIIDEQGVHNMMEDLGAIYRTLAENKSEGDLEDIPIYYEDYSTWYNRLLYEGFLETQRSYWSDEFREPYRSNNPSLYRIGSTGTKAGTPDPLEHRTRLGEETYNRLKAFCAANNTTLFKTLLASYFFLLRHTAQSNDILVGVQVDTRAEERLKKVVGNFFNIIPLRINMENMNAFEQLLGQVDGKYRQGLENSLYPFDMLSDELEIGNMPLFIMPQRMNFTNWPPGIELEVGRYRRALRSGDLAFHYLERGRGLELVFSCNADMLGRDYCRILSDRYLKIIETIAL